MMKASQRKCVRCREPRDLDEFSPTEVGNEQKRRRICVYCEQHEPSTQVCTQCGEEQDVGRFHVISVRDGTRSKVCKGCSAKNLQRRLGKRKTDDQIAEERERARREWVAEGHDALAANRAAAGSSRTYQEAR